MVKTERVWAVKETKTDINVSRPCSLKFHQAETQSFVDGSTTTSVQVRS